MGQEDMNIAATILQETLGISRSSWLRGDYPIKPVEHLFFAEIREIGLQKGRLERYPEVKEYLGIFPPEFIEFKYQEAASSPDFAKFKHAYFEALLNEDGDLYVRRSAIYLLHEALMRRDFGEDFRGFGSECVGLTKEAENYLAGRNSVVKFNNDGQCEQYLLELKRICSSESVRQNIVHHLMGLGVSVSNIDAVTRCVEIANKFTTLRGGSVEDLLELAAQDKLDQVPANSAPGRSREL